MSKNEFQFEGKWISSLPIEVDDFSLEYSIQKEGVELKVGAIDLTDNEKMDISDIVWNGDTLIFNSFMPSTGRIGFNEFRLKVTGNIETRFTYTVLEELKLLETSNEPNSHPIQGSWVSVDPQNSDDYLTEYIIESDNKSFKVKAVDLRDDEEMEISNINWQDKTLTFTSFTPSTDRIAINRFRVKENGNIESKFTFTLVRELKRKYI